MGVLAAALQPIEAAKAIKRAATTLRIAKELVIQKPPSGIETNLRYGSYSRPEAHCNPASFCLRRTGRFKVIVAAFLERHVRDFAAGGMIRIVRLIKRSVGQKRSGKSLVIVQHQFAVPPLSVEIKIRPAVGDEMRLPSWGI